jgi:threonine dehydrogenase-like Zn-dependent dehydrogenase
VLGDGKLGNLCAQVVALSGCELLVVGKHDAKLDLLRARGIPVVRLDGFGPERRYDVVVEATGNPSGLELALKMLRPRGTLVLKSTYAAPFLFNPASLVIDEIAVVSSRCGPFAPALRALARGWVDPRPLIAATYPLTQGVQALAQAAEKGATKVLLRPAST